MDLDEKEPTTDVCSSTAAPQFYWIFAAVLAALTVIGNGFVIFVNVTKKVEPNATNFIITNLAIVDFGTGVSLFVLKCLPRFDMPSAIKGKLWAELFCRVYCADYPLWALLNTSIFNLMLVTVDRYLSVVTPFYYKIVFRGNLRLATCVMLTWILGVVTSSYVMFSWAVSGDICVIDLSLPSWFFLWGGYWSLFGMLLIPTLFMLSAYAHISYILHKMPRASQGRRVQKRVTLSCLAVVTVFFCCWLPDILFFFLFSLNLPSLRLSLESWLYHFVLNLGFSNSILNPFLYAFLNPNYSKILKHLFNKQRSHRPQTPLSPHNATGVATSPKL